MTIKLPFFFLLLFFDNNVQRTPHYGRSHRFQISVDVNRALKKKMQGPTCIQMDLF